jgi:hypothetical protein
MRPAYVRHLEEVTGAIKLPKVDTRPASGGFDDNGWLECVMRKLCGRRRIHVVAPVANCGDGFPLGNATQNPPTRRGRPVLPSCWSKKPV